MEIRAASAEEINARNRLTAAVWGNRLTVEQYLERERRLLATVFARRAMRSWVLVDGKEILASCESYSMPALFAGKRGVAQGMASVFVEEKHRGHGHARALLGGLLRSFESERALASILFSEVGTKLYGALGYVSREMRARQFEPASGDVSAVAQPFSRAQSEQVLGPLLEEPREARFRIVLYHPQLEWHRERSSVYHRFLHPERLDPDSLSGAITGKAWIAWTPDYRLDRLMVLDWRADTAEEKAALADALRRAAHALGMPVAETWEGPEGSLPGGKVVPREDEVPMIRPIAPALSPADWKGYGRGCWV